MRLDKELCLGGRLNNKEIFAIKYNGYIIYQYIYDPDELRNVYTLSVIDASRSAKVIYNECLYDLGKITDWGDGTIDSRTYHTYSQPGTYIVSSTGFVYNNEIVFSGVYPTVKSVDKLRADIINGYKLFHRYYYITSENLTLPNTSLMTDMEEMFYSCYSLTTLDLSSFDTSNVTDMVQMFAFCDNLTELNLSNFDISYSCDTTAMLAYCSKLHTLRLDNCNYTTISKIIKSDAFPTNTITGTTRKIYCKRENIGSLVAPRNWEFAFIDGQIEYNEPTEVLSAPEFMMDITEEQLVINENFIVYDAENENLDIN